MGLELFSQIIDDFCPGCKHNDMLTILEELLDYAPFTTHEVQSEGKQT
jgi:hypothetical protein